MANKTQTPDVSWSVNMPTIPKNTSGQGKSFWIRQSEKIAKEKESQQQLRNQLIEQKLQMNQQVLGKMKPTKATFDNRTNETLTTLVDQYVDIKNGMMKSEDEAGYVSSQEGMRALNMIQDQAGDIAFFNNQLSTDILPHLRKMIGKDASLGYKDSKGAMSTAVPTGPQRLMMAIDNNSGNVSWEFNDKGELELVMPAGEEDGYKYDETRLNLNEYGRYIEKGEEFFFDIPDIDAELNAAAEVVVGTPDKPKLDKNTKTYYTYDTAKDGKIKFETVRMTDDDRQRAVNDLMAVKQFDHLLYDDNRVNDRKALWQDCVGEGTKGAMIFFEEDYDPGTGQNTAWNGSKEQLETLHRWLAETAVDQNLAPGTHVTGMSKRSKSPGGGSGLKLTQTQLNKIAQYEELYLNNKKLVEDMFTQKEVDIGKFHSFGSKATKNDLIKQLNKSIDFKKGGGFKIGSEINIEEPGREGGGGQALDPTGVYWVDDGLPTLIDIDFQDPQEILNFLNQQFIGDENVIYNLNQMYSPKTDTKETTKSSNVDLTPEELYAKYVKNG